jgi:carboxypeptidase family protein
MSRKLSRRLLFGAWLSLGILIAFSPAPGWAQITQGSISISVLDPSGAVVPEAQLKLQDMSTSAERSGTTGTAGTYTFPSLPTGLYRLTVSKTGFESQVFNDVVVSATRITDIKAELKIGAVSVEVVVSEHTVPVIETTSNATTGTVDMRQVEDLPLIGRDISTLARLVPGFAGGTWNGLPYMATGNNIDGVVGTTQRMKFAGAATPLVQPRVENMQEMTVQTDQLNLNSGYGLSNMQVNFVTRRGSNKFHGRIYEDHRNRVLNANTWLNNAAGLPRPAFIKNEFGGSLGGPIVKDKLFVFGTFAMSKQPGSNTNSNAVLSPSAQAGIFKSAAFPAGISVLAMGGSGGVSAMPTTVNPDISAIFSEINSGLSSAKVTPDADPNLVDVNWQYPSPITQYFPTLRIDYNIKDNLRLFGSWNMTTLTQPNQNVPPLPGAFFAKYGGSTNEKVFTAALGFDWTLAPTVVNTFRAGYLFNRFAYGYDLTPAWLSQPAIIFPYGASGLELNNLPITTYYPLVNASDNVTWQKGSHTLSFGFSYYREQDHYYNAPAGFPFINLGIDANDPAGGVITAAMGAGATANDIGNAKNLYATLTGRINSVNPGGAGFPLDIKTGQYSTSVGGYYLDELQHGWGLFLQDSWKYKPTLTFNYGLRWDFVSPSTDLTGGYHSADNVGIFGPSGVGNLFKPGELTSDPNGLNPQYVARHQTYSGWNVTPQPAIGFAWNPSKTEGFLGRLMGENKTVVRAAFSLRRVTEPYQFFWNQASNEGYAFYQSFRLSPEVPGGTCGLATGQYSAGCYNLGDAQPSPFFVSPPTYQDVIPESQETFFGYWSGVNGMNEKVHQPYVESWNFGIQRELGQSNVLEVRYVGNRSLHQWIVENPNEVNIFENGFLNEFKLAQANLAASGGASFAPGPNALPIMTAAAGGNGAFFTNGAFITDLNNGAAGDFATILAGDPTYLCNLIGGANFTPCAGFAGAGKPINFFQANPYAAGKAIGYETDTGWGNYHALQIDLRQKPWHGAQFDVNYTWSHTLGVQPNNSWTGALTMFTMRDLRTSYGPTGFDYRHVIHASGTYDLPFGKGKAFASQGGIADKIVGGWSIGTIVGYQTGGPYELLGGFNTVNGPGYTPVGDRYGDSGVNFNGITQNDLQASKVVHVPGKTYAYTVNPSIIGTNKLTPATTAGAFGYHPWLYGPHAFTQDMALTKSVPIRENVRFSIQAEFINLWNHPVWAVPAGGYNSTSQGFIQNTSTSIQSASFGISRVVQAGTGLPGLGSRQIEFRANLEF